MTRATTHAVYWCELQRDSIVPRVEICRDLAHVLETLDRLRQDKNNFLIVSCSEPEGLVVNGVATPPADYHWPKRRPG